MDEITTWTEQVINWLVHIVDTLGIVGIFVMTFLESTFAPIPSEMTMIPAGYLVQQGQMGFLGVFLASTFGTISGAYFNYWLARRFGRGLFLRYGKYFMMTPEKLEKLELFFAKHGAFSTFTGRMIPGIRHYISFPAGLARMNVRTFLIFTALGGSIWMLVLITLGYHIGKNQELAMQYMPMIKLGIVAFVVVAGALYALRNRYKARRRS